jgi:virulence-associated protein VagC
MTTKKTRLSMTGNSDAVGIPQEFQIGSGKTEIQPRGDTQVIRPQQLSWAPLIDSLKKFSTDYMVQGRRQTRQ